MAFAAIREFLKLQGIHYQAPAKAGVLALEMEQYRALAQAARKEFTDLLGAGSDQPMDEPGPGLAASFLGLSKRRRDDGRTYVCLEALWRCS